MKNDLMNIGPNDFMGPREIWERNQALDLTKPLNFGSRRMVCGAVDDGPAPFDPPGMQSFKSGYAFDHPPLSAVDRSFTCLS